MPGIAPDKSRDLPGQAYSAKVLQYIENTPVLDEWPGLRVELQHSITGEPPWKLALPILACQASGSEPDLALPMTAAWLCLRHAAHLLDRAFEPGTEIIDQKPSNKVGLAVSLVFTGYKFIAGLGDPTVIGRVLVQLSDSGLQSALGQKMLSSPMGGEDVSADALERYWQAMILKSGSIYRAGTAGGAAVSTNRQDWITALGDYGSALGVMLQVLDDCRDQYVDQANRPDLPGLPTLMENLIPGSGDQDLSQTISLILLEWQRRALDALMILPESNAKRTLEQIPYHILEVPNE